MRLRKILLTTDLSDLSKDAFAPTAHLARSQGARIDLVHAAEFPPPTGVALTGPTWEKCLASWRRQLKALAESAVFDGVAVEPHLVEGYGPEAIKEFQEKGGHDLIATASHGYTGLKHLLLGSFAERVVRLAPCPMLTLRARGHDALQVRRILFPYDFSEPSRAALETLRAFAEIFSAPITLFHVLPADMLPYLGHGEELALANQLPRFWEEAHTSAVKRLEEIAREELAGFQVSTDVAQGSPVREIVRRAKDARVDLIVMATHGRTGLSHALMGSVAERVVRKAPCSTVTVRPPSGVKKGGDQ